MEQVATAQSREQNTAALLILVTFSACSDASIAPDAPVASPVDAASPDAYITPTWPFALPPLFPTPRLPPGARLTPALAELGRYLFYDVRLSGNGRSACASCHKQSLAFSDGVTTPFGSTGNPVRRNSPTLTNVAYNASHTWANAGVATLEQQALGPLTGMAPVELGIVGFEAEILQRFASNSPYQGRFAAAFPGQTDAINFPNIVKAIAAFERRLISGTSRFDAFKAGNQDALTLTEKRGRALFLTERLGCHHCHGGFNLTVAVSDASPAFFNTGLYNLPDGRYPATDRGLIEVTQLSSDEGKFKPPTLRNIAVTAPYMHDGSVATLEQVIDIYQRGGRLISVGPLAGDGRSNPHKSPLISGFSLTSQERADLLAFLLALTDQSFLSDPTLADPF
jgi:cytochrome c peroxidase